MMKSGPEFESLISELVCQIKKNTPLEQHEVSRNRITGASGYRHQIDISLHGQDVIYIIEAKNWNKKVGLETVLVLAGRLMDIRSKVAPISVHASVISTKKETRGATKLAKHLGISIDVVESETQYAVTFANRHFVGLQEKLSLGDAVTATISRVCKQCGKRFNVRGNERICELCEGK